MAEETTQGNPETAKNNTLTDKYAILHVFQSILWIILVVDLAGGFIAGINVFKHIWNGMGNTYCWNSMDVWIIWNLLWN